MIRSAPPRPKQSEPCAVLAAVGLPVPLVGEMGEVGASLGHARIDHAAAMAAVAAVGPAARRVLLAAEAQAAVAAGPLARKSSRDRRTWSGFRGVAWPILSDLRRT